jgi:hypothetical protein
MGKYIYVEETTMMLGERHYVPVLKWKQGEQKALEALTPAIRDGITPLIEIAPIDWDFENEVPKKTIDEHLINFGDSLQRSWQLTRPVFVDLYYLDPQDRMVSNQHPLAYVLQEARTRNIGVIPVTSSNRDSAYHSEVAVANQQDHLGIAIRLNEHDFDSLQVSIDNLLTIIQVNPSEVDLIIDYQHVTPQERTRTAIFLTGLVDSLPYLSEWRNVVLCGTGFPANLSAVGANTIDQLERTEWIVWKRVVSGRIDRRPIFSDYCISSPEPFDGDPRFINMSANIRYTGDDKFIIFKGTVTRKFGNAQYHQLAAQVVSHAEYSGAPFSAGDQYIYDVSKQTDGPGNATNWRKTGTNHHLSYVVTELSTLTLP